MEYKYIYELDGDGGESDELIECDVCAAKAPITRYGAGFICELCACSFAGNEIDRKSENYYILSTICAVGNKILDAVTERTKNIKVSCQTDDK